ncbi:MAG: TonB-dependent receptor plug domain-containing protein, partial [Limnobacter sp.]|nr:TonB-dependent receptor plug domain-containing protein [Limnobacter sp.]
MFLPLASVAANPTEQSPALEPVTVRAQREALSSASVHKAQEDLQQVPGGTAVVPAQEFESGRAMTTKDMLDYVPGVYSQSRVNEEARLSIRGSGLSRTFHLRGIRLLQDGIPINLADGGSDFQDIDPFALQHVEVYKGSNALQYGAASLGGAVNFVLPTGYTFGGSTARADAGSFGLRRAAFKTGGVHGETDYYVSLSRLQSDGFRDFSAQKNTRLNGNAGFKLGPTAETRFYLNTGDMNQELPGSLTYAQLQADPRQANTVSKARNSQRDFRITRLANKTTWVSSAGDEWNFGAYSVNKNLYHPLSFGLVDQKTASYGVFGQWLTQGQLGAMRHDVRAGWNLVSGETEARVYAHNQGVRTALSSSEDQLARNTELFAESRLHLHPTLQWITS